MLDGLLHNESSIQILEHATDTAGATEMIFAMFPQYGYRLTPRIRNLGDRKGTVNLARVGLRIRPRAGSWTG